MAKKLSSEYELLIADLHEVRAERDAAVERMHTLEGVRRTAQGDAVAAQDAQFDAEQERDALRARLDALIEAVEGAKRRGHCSSTFVDVALAAARGE